MHHKSHITYYGGTKPCQEESSPLQTPTGLPHEIKAKNIEAFKNRPETINEKVSEASVVKGHGRIDHHQAFIITDTEWLKERHEKRQSIESIINIESTRIIKKSESVESKFYISSKK